MSDASGDSSPGVEKALVAPESPKRNLARPDGPSAPPSDPSSAPPDLRVGAFTVVAPWEVRPGEMAWRDGIDDLRVRTRAQVPHLIRNRKAPPLRRMATTAAVLGPAIAGWYLRDRKLGAQRSRRSLSARLRVAFGRLGPTYIKLGQIISSGEGLFPAELVEEMRLLRDRVPPESFADVKKVIEEDLHRPVDQVFAHLAREPIAAASIAQVHPATLLSGQQVVVKIQRPKVAELVKRDLAVMSWLAPLLVGRIPVAALANPPALIELFAETIVEELDFRLEAQNMLDIASVMATSGQRVMVVPRPHPELVTRRVLVMEHLEGFAWDDVKDMRSSGIDTAAVLHASLIAFLEGVMLYGVFHGDLHGGNLLVQPDGKVALLDFGITGRLDEHSRLAYLRLVVGATTNDIRAQVEALQDFGALPRDVKVETLISDLGLDRPVKDPTTMTPEELTDELREVAKALLGYGAKLPKELMLLVKNLLFLNGAVATMAPDVDILAQIGDIASYFATHHGERIAKEVGIDPRLVPIDLDAIRASMGLSQDVEKLSYHEIQERRDIIRKRLTESRRRHKA